MRWSRKEEKSEGQDGIEEVSGNFSCRVGVGKTFKPVSFESQSNIIRKCPYE
jgi:hypothetical protein